MAASKKYIVEFLATVRGDKVVLKSLKRIEGQHMRLTRNFKKGSKQGDAFIKALKRAAIVAPIWLALRSAMMLVLRTIQEGAQYWFEFDKALQKSQQVIHGVTGDMSEAIEGLTKNVKNLSLETGQSMAKLTNTFYRFGTVGLDFQRSMEGMEQATKLSTVMFGNAEEIGRVLAQVYRLLGDTMHASIPPQERMAAMGAMLFKLWQTNAFEIGEMTQALQKFLPTANVFNFTVEESLSLLASLQTAGLKAGRAGRLLRTSMNKLVDNLDEVVVSLGVDVNPELDSTFDVLMKILSAVNKLSKSGDELPIEAIQAMGIFGGVRSREAAMALVSLYDVLLKNLRDINPELVDHNKLVGEQEERYQKILKSTHKQIERFQNLRKLVGEAFVKGVTGADDFKDALADINEYMDGLIWFTGKIGKALNMVGTFLIKDSRAMYLIYKNAERATMRTELLEKVAKGLAGELEDADMDKLIQDIRQARFEFKNINVDKLIKDLSNIRWGFREPIKLPEAEIPEEEPEIIKEINNERAKLSGELEKQLSLLQRELEYIELEVKGYSEAEIAEKKLLGFLEEKVEHFNEVKKAAGAVTEELKLERTVAAVMAQDYEQLYAIFQKTQITEKEILEIEKMRQELVKQRLEEQREITEKLLESELQRLKIEGATERQLIEAQIALEDAFNIGQDKISLLEKELDLQEAITEENKNRNEVSSNTVKLWKIAQSYGKSYAQDMARALRGEISPIALGGKTERLFRAQFKGRWEAAKAAEYWGGVDIAKRPDREIDVREIQKQIQTRIAEIGRTESTIDQMIATNTAETASGINKLLDFFQKTDLTGTNIRNVMKTKPQSLDDWNLIRSTTEMAEVIKYNKRFGYMYDPQKARFRPQSEIAKEQIVEVVNKFYLNGTEMSKEFITQAISEIKKKDSDLGKEIDKRNEKF